MWQEFWDEVVRPTLEIGLYVGVPAGILVGAVVYHSSA